MDKQNNMSIFKKRNEYQKHTVAFISQLCLPRMQMQQFHFPQLEKVELRKKKMVKRRHSAPCLTSIEYFMMEYKYLDEKELMMEDGVDKLREIIHRRKEYVKKEVDEEMSYQSEEDMVIQADVFLPSIREEDEDVLVEDIDDISEIKRDGFFSFIDGDKKDENIIHETSGDSISDSKSSSLSTSSPSLNLDDNEEIPVITFPFIPKRSGSKSLSIKNTRRKKEKNY